MSGLDFYNDNDPAACAWIEQLIAAGPIPPGRVDNRSIADVRATDLAGLRRVHFFAGIGGWAEALRLADFPDWLPTWTGSPPCQPFSAAGKRAGRDDARHLGPVFVDLVRAGRPPVLFGEQVASSDAIGRAAKPGKQGAGAEPAWAWWDDLSLRLEAAGYAAWAAVVPAAGIGAPHIRERLFFGAVDLRFAAGGVAHGDDARLEGRREPGRERAAECAAREGGMARGLADTDHQRRDRFDAQLQRGRQEQAGAEAAGVGAARGLADADGRDARAERQQRGGQHGQQPRDGGAGGLADAERRSSERHGQQMGGTQGEDSTREEERERIRHDSGDGFNSIGVADSERLGWGGWKGATQRREHDRPDAGWIEGHNEPPGVCETGYGSRGSRPTNGFWGTADWLLCRDERWRPVEPGTFPLAPGVSGRVGLLRGYGNAIVPQAAAEFIAASREVLIETGIWDALRRAHALREDAA